MSDKTRSLQQQRAKHALERIKETKAKYQEEGQEKFVGFAKDIPASILINGLGQAAATLCAQARGNPDDPHWAIYEALQSWLCRSDASAPYTSDKDLLTAITEGERRNYLHAQAEALAYLEWYKKFAVAFLSNPKQPKTTEKR